jgi:hypothetical protein
MISEEEKEKNKVTLEEEEESDDDSEFDDEEFNDLFSMLKSITKDTKDTSHSTEFNTLLKEKMLEETDEDLNITILSLSKDRKEFNSYKGELISKLLSSPHPYGGRKEQCDFILSVINNTSSSSSLEKGKNAFNNIFSLFSSALKSNDDNNKDDISSQKDNMKNELD